MTEPKPQNSSSSLIPPFLRIPWWTGVLLAITFYCSLKYLVPQLQFTNQTLHKLTLFAPSLAPMAAIVFLLLAAMRLYDADDEKLSGDSDEQEMTDN